MTTLWLTPIPTAVEYDDSPWFPEQVCFRILLDKVAVFFGVYSNKGFSSAGFYDRGELYQLTRRNS